jgi:hypothetical protein
MKKIFNFYVKTSAIKRFIFIALLAIILCFTVKAQPSLAAGQTKTDPASAADTNTKDETRERVRQLEEQVSAMRAQIEALTNLINQTQESARKENSISEPASAKSEVKTAETIKTESKPATQTKQLGVDIGSARLTPYGTIYFNAFGNSAGTNNSDVPLFATPTGNGNVSSTVRQTRLGVRLEGAKAGDARLSAILEADFFGGFPSVGIGENFGVVRLRLANARLDWEKTSVTLGQDWRFFDKRRLFSATDKRRKLAHSVFPKPYRFYGRKLARHKKGGKYRSFRTLRSLENFYRRGECRK